MSQPIVKVIGLTKKMKHKKIVDDVSFDIYKGEIVGFLGPNGSGKTTTMKMMAGLMSISSGDVVINGYSIKNSKEKALTYVGGMIEYPEMYQFFSGFDNLVYFQRMLGPINKPKINQITHLVGLSGAIHEKVKTYSLGMKQRLGIAQALLSSPDVLILDEPTNGLDPEGIHEIRDYLKKMAREENMAIFISSHLLSEMEQICDRLMIIQKGQITDTEVIEKFAQNNEKLITVSLKVDSKVNALSVLKKNVVEVTEKEDCLSLRIPYSQIPTIVNELVFNKIKIYSISPVAVSLEERYLAKTSGGS